MRSAPKLMPTPSLSFAVRDLHCDGGIVITASHNPAKYNGYKVYGSDGCQITTEAAKTIQQEIDAVDAFRDVRHRDFQKLLECGTISYIGEDTVRRYLDAVDTASVLPADVARDVAIVYTPLNGTGISCVPRCLNEHGFTNITIPDEQKTPDGNFPTCPYPNPEIREALEVGLAWAERTGSDLLLVTFCFFRKRVKEALINSALRLHASALSSCRPAILSVALATPAVLSPKSTVHPRKSRAPHLISGSLKDWYFFA